MASRTVTVLTLNGRRHQVKVEPNVTILEILERVCQKFSLNVNEYDLKHHNKVLDLSTMFRFTGLPNNALLEMAPATKVRTESDVMLVLQLEDGSRLEGTFKPSASLLDVLQQLCAEKANAEANPVMIYMRREVLWGSMPSTTLKSLGLTGGRAIIRLLQRKPEELRTQANVSAPLPCKEKSDDIDEPMSEPEKKSSPKEQQKKVTINPEFETEPEFSNESKKYKSSSDSPEPGPSCSKSEPHKTEYNPQDIEHEPKADSIINILGDREAVLYHLDSAERSSLELPDSFFELTTADARKIQADLKNKIRELEDAPLLTSQYRQLEEEKRILSQLGRYKTTVVRVQFRDRYVLQGIFKPHESIANVMTFVRNYLSDPTIEFHLYTTPPKNILSGDVILVEAQLVPTALLHFGCEHDCSPCTLLKPAFYEQLSNAAGATAVATRSRVDLVTGDDSRAIAADTPIETESESDRDMQQPSSSSSSAANTGRGQKPPTNFRPSSAVQPGASDVKMPKWFKPTGK
ncbi:tether containing UBX domain for GLUT4 [Sabethes cyaneus]|uniref:tether containing UBX domain for GLUT4 n=1 Tax=Sabethes cyaneus TaxID=53552 RepID=UPI00237E6F4A|nr:tether containing UBX domain for GLUT4 [Sabethes cyaneus]